jgi:hypothetical protein
LDQAQITVDESKDESFVAFENKFDQVKPVTSTACVNFILSAEPLFGCEHRTLLDHQRDSDNTFNHSTVLRIGTADILVHIFMTGSCCLDLILPRLCGLLLILLIREILGQIIHKLIHRRRHQSRQQFQVITRRCARVTLCRYDFLCAFEAGG